MSEPHPPSTTAAKWEPVNLYQKPIPGSYYYILYMIMNYWVSDYDYLMYHTWVNGFVRPEGGKIRDNDYGWSRRRSEILWQIAMKLNESQTKT